MIEARFECVVKLIGGLRVIALALCVDGLTEVQDDLRLFGLLHGELTGAAHEGSVARDRGDHPQGVDGAL
jgi:hypothetical protein